MTSPPTDRTERYVEALRREFPALRIVDKRTDGFSKLVDGALRVVTFGSQRHYLTRYVTTIGATIYVPSDWSSRPDVQRYLVMRHEAVHLRQFARLGLVPMALLYLLPILPLGLAWGRARLEWEAYEETLRATHETLGRDAARDPALEAHIVAQFTGGAYGWMWPFPKVIRRWIQAALAKLDG